ncbi:MAG: formamidopyrimidine-DNA glycosylase [Gammaproteobacteria bacterium]|nr:formamidopyrimidine-DNA glycosylase [Gammaproteobacteria bacterium]
MPEMPDLTVYLEHLEARLLGATLDGVRLGSPFVLRSVTPGVDEVRGLRVQGVRRLAKQIVLELEGDCFMVVHLMISGRLQWRAQGVRKPGRNVLALFDFSTGTLVFTEASRKKRAALRFVRGRTALAALDPGGLEVLQVDLEAFADRLRNANHTLKRALTDQRVLAGVGNAYSDEILLTAGLSPFKRAGALSDEEVERLFAACRSVLTEWTERLRLEAGGRFPAKVTAFHKEMAVHGKYRQPCPRCGSPVQRIVYAENEANYCARCQTDGRLLADRSLSRLLKDNWPKRLEDLE